MTAVSFYGEGHCGDCGATWEFGPVADGTVLESEHECAPSGQEKEQLRGEADALRTAARSAAVLLRSTADRAETGQRIGLATLRAAAQALDEVERRMLDTLKGAAR